jgi:hypothetical protein
MILLFLVILTFSSPPIVPYLDTDYTFHYNYTGTVIEGEPMIGFTCITDNLDMDSLATIYPTVVTLGEDIFEEMLDNPEEFCERFRR